MQGHGLPSRRLAAAQERGLPGCAPAAEQLPELLGDVVRGDGVLRAQREAVRAHDLHLAPLPLPVAVGGAGHLRMGFCMGPSHLRKPALTACHCALHPRTLSWLTQACDEAGCMGAKSEFISMQRHVDDLWHHLDHAIASWQCP